jgi:peptidoglycan/LPS O-acetylase OafA/YrhL
MARPPKLHYLPGLDGLRALAVIAVVLYHAGQTWLPGGFLGVEVFFVISGYIITSGLLADWRETGSVPLLSFWRRRALRLLPALFSLLAILLVAGALFMPDKIDQLRADALAAGVYVTNWKLIFGHVPYFQSFGPPPLLQHLWSLAVEEQFYIVWPLLLTVLLRLLRPRATAFVIFACALASTAAMALLFTDVYSTSRIYYGTDTRACGLLLGAALAFVVRPGVSPSRAGAFAVFFAGVLGLAGLSALALRLGEYEPMLYKGGFLVTDVATAAVIVAVAAPRSLASRIIGVAPLRWLGVRSYGIYLWHWPLLLLFKPDTGSAGLDLALCLAAVVAASALSYALVEKPARTGALGRLVRSWTMPAPSTWSYRKSFGTIAAAVAIVSSAVSVAAITPPSARASRSSDVYGPLIIDVSPSDQVAGSDASLPSLPASLPEPAPEPEAATRPPPADPPQPPAPPPLPVVGVAPIPPGLNIVAIGDSVMLGASRQMAYMMGPIDVDAEVARQVSTGVEVLKAHLAGGTPDVVVIGLGSNGGFTGRQFDQLMEQLAGVKLVIFVNVRVPRAWEGPNDKVIAEGVAAYPNTVLVDWYAATADHPEVFGEDKVHLTGAGVRLYAGLIADAIVSSWK